MAGLAYDPQHLTFVANGRSFMLVRHFKAPANAALPHLDPADAARVVRAAVRSDPGLAQKFNRVFSHTVGNVFRFDARSSPVADAILQIQRKEMYLLALGPAVTIPADPVAAAGGHVRAYKVADAGALARTGHGAAPPIPRDPVDRLVLVVQGIGALTAKDVGPKLWEKIEGLTRGRTVAALTTALTAFVMAQLTGPAALILDSALLGYGLYSLGTGIFQFADDLHSLWDRIRTARTREDLKVLSIALAVLLAGFAIERIISLLARGGAKKGSGINNEADAKGQVAPSPANKPAPVPGKADPPASSSAQQSKLAPGGGLKHHEDAGGHLIDKHVGKSEAELRARLAAEPRISGSSSFYDRAAAERGVSDAIDGNSKKINDWLATPSKKLRIDHTGSGAVGVSVERGAGAANVSSTRVILVKDASLPTGYRVQTGFPTKP